MKATNMLRILRVILVASLLTIAVLSIRPSTPVLASTTTVFYGSSKCYLQEQDATYLTAQVDATADTLNTTTTTPMYVGQCDGCSAGYDIWRGGVWFNTSGLPDDAVISAATFSAYIYDIHNTDDFNVVTCNGTGMTNPFAAADYGTLLTSTTSFGYVNTSTLTYNTWMNIPLNAAGISTINSAGNTGIALRSGNDISAHAPTAAEHIMFRAEVATSYKLTITYTGSPTIQTQPATSVTISTARLNSLVTNDGGLSCYTRFQYGETAAYGTDTAWVNSAVTGSTPYETISGLAENTTYHFRAQIYNAVNGIGSPSNGLDTTFTTGTASGVPGSNDSFGRPLNLVATPISSTEVFITWEKGSLAYKTKIQYSTSAFPIDYNDGSTAYFDEYTSTVLSDLIAGTTYYFSAWSFTPADNGSLTDYWSDYEPTSLDYIADSGTNTTTITDNALLFTTDQYYRGCSIHNITAGDEEREVTDYDGATTVLTLDSAVSGQTDGDQYYVILRCDAVCTTPASATDWALPDDTDSFDEPVSTHLTNFPMHEIVEMWCTVSGMEYEIAWVFWGLIAVTLAGIGVALAGESALLTIAVVVILISGGYFLGVFALWVAVLYVILSVPLGWALSKW